jgi:hypothetical protein
MIPSHTQSAMDTNKDANMDTKEEDANKDVK